MVDTRIQINLRVSAQLLAQVDQRVERKRREVAKAGIRPSVWSRNDQLVELLEQALRGARR